MAPSTLSRLRLGGLSVGLLLILLLVSLHLMSSAVQNSVELSRFFVPLLIFNLAGMFVLFVLITYNSIRLIRQYLRHSAGSRLILRMVMIFTLIALTPAGVVYYYSFSFLQGGIDSWFDVKIDQAMEDARDLAQASLSLNQRVLLKYTEQQLLSIADASESALSLTIAKLRQQSGALELSLSDLSGQIIAYSNAVADELVPAKPDDYIMQRLREGSSYVGLAREKDELMIRVAVADPLGRPLIIQGLYPASERVSTLSEKLELAYNRYKELSFLRQSLKRNFSLTLFLVLMFAVLSAVWAAFFSARRMVAPIANIAAGTKSVAEGDYDRQLPVPRRADELAFLVASFNIMTRRIRQARDQAGESQREVEGQRAYLETVLARLSSGVLTFDAQHKMRTANPASEKILGIDLNRLFDVPMQSLALESSILRQFVEGLEVPLRQVDEEWRGELTLFGSEGRKVLICRTTPFAQSNGRKGHIVLIDDVTALIRAQRNAAWGEVARRLAHEIKNPLTPIQLSAERLRHKYLKTMAEQDAEVLDRATHTIVQQVEAMKSMVNDFSEYARPSQMDAKPLKLDKLIGEVADLYRGSRKVKFEIDLMADKARVEADSLRIRQVVHNLVKNAIEALEGSKKGKVSLISRVLSRDDHPYYEIRVQDSGPGFPEEMMQQLFEPYVTSKTKGTGLGLAIVKKIVEEHGGIIWAENSNKGACMVMQLPMLLDLEESEV
ncbi:MAG: HAMP domain-containing protein [Candidatus Thiodiazotropha sp. (ex Lucinoma aequizonata)]|nr:HAMP domain-containing protein [Candidatus Thiodiazotropha sp. (ex Lucinoma aequizonata)]MCU7888649.1 HAMP domain-containing protein [Candidatus Thiodiazotropha sp. (ex Lucinoma aequizonata)]MCU7896968.1 HAMP domain-containing protein [Candidatus Thiodiazotropha sp. (ex Lucinoma aequizonata)]MCU7899084.1 HAMP domain-containing protein [Candidatus Thiodiazotropha sp. (ex Lucinoma aequizonata)]MCU7902277.1 HAMP domain-containing protein [Candidatus Thiodiazotropha sp. (ex Lucinoma aequizonata)